MVSNLVIISGSRTKYRAVGSGPLKEEMQRIFPRKPNTAVELDGIARNLEKRIGGYGLGNQSL